MHLESLLAPDAIAAGLDAEFPGEEWSGYHLRPSTLRPEDLDDAERELGVRFPVSFRQGLLQWDFGDLSLGNVWFGSDGDYLGMLRQQNVSDPSVPRWWGDGDRPSATLLIGATDGYLVLLDLVSGSALAMPRSKSIESANQVAANLELLIRGLGTLCLAREGSSDRRQLASEIAAAVDGSAGSAFWTDLSLGVS
jgi:hypothetical protein